MKHLLYIPCLLLFAACSLKPAVRPHTPKPVVPLATPTSHKLGYEERLRFSELYHAGLVARVGQNFDAAFELFNEARRINPSSAETAYELAQLYQDVAGLDTAHFFPIIDSLLTSSVRLSPQNKYYKIALIESLTKQERYAETIELAREVAESSPTATDYLRLEKLCELAKDYEGAISALDHLERIEGKSLENSVNKFWAYRQLGRESEGYRVMEDLCSTFPTELRYRVSMGDLYLFCNHEDMALATYQDVLTLDPDNEAAQYAMLNYYQQQADSANFNALVRRYILNPRAADKEKEMLLANLLYDHGISSRAGKEMMVEILNADKPNPALVNVCAEYLRDELDAQPDLKPFFDRILQIDPLQSDIRKQLLRYAINSGNDDDILRLCREGHLYEPSEARYYYFEGLTLYRKNQTEEALDVFDDGTQYADENTPRQYIAMLYAERANILLDIGEFEEAFFALDSSLVYDPGNPEVLATYAESLLELDEQPEKALIMSQQAVDADPSDPFYLSTHAYALAELKRYEEAKVLSDSAMTIAARMPDIGESTYYGRLLDRAGDVYYHLGHTGEAVRIWQQALTNTRDPEIRSEIQRKIRRRRI